MRNIRRFSSIELLFRNIPYWSFSNMKSMPLLLALFTLVSIPVSTSSQHNAIIKLNQLQIAAAKQSPSGFRENVIQPFKEWFLRVHQKEYQAFSQKSPRQQSFAHMYITSFGAGEPTNARLFKISGQTDVKNTRRHAINFP